MHFQYIFKNIYCKKLTNLLDMIICVLNDILFSFFKYYLSIKRRGFGFWQFSTFKTVSSNLFNQLTNFLWKTLTRLKSIKKIKKEM